MPESLVERQGDVACEVLEAAAAAGADAVVAPRTVDPRLLAAAASIERCLPVVWVDPPPFVDERGSYDLKRFSRYWQRARTSAMRPTHGSSPRI
jgi:hypothetical protein